MSEITDDRVAGLFQTLATDTPGSVRERARELAAGFVESDHLPFAPGDEAGPYEIVRVLGSGGQAVVYEAKHAALDRRVALKVPRKEVGDRIVREAKLLATLSHPAIVQVFDLSLEGPVPYLVLELCEGFSLEERLEVVAPDGLPLSQVRAIARSILEALAFAHERGVIHRDVKPSNVLFDKEHHAKVADFGIGTVARADELAQSVELSQLSLLAGTPLYVAPEQENPALRVEGRLDGRADLFSFGKVLFQMLTGASPRTIRPPSRLRPGLDPAWDDYVFQLTEERPERRFGTAREALEAMPSGSLAPASPAVALVPASTPEVPGRAGDWELRSELGRRPRGILYRAVHARPGITARLLVRAKDAPPLSKLVVDRMVAEARSARAVHPDLLRMLDVGTTADGRPFLALEPVEAASVEEIVATRGPLPVRDAVRIARVVAAALAARRSLLPLDVRSSDVFVSATGAVKVAAVRFAPDSLGGRVAENEETRFEDVRSLAPELLRGVTSEPDAPSCGYSIGLLLHEMLTGKLPYPSTTPAGIVGEKLAGNLVPPEVVLPHFPSVCRVVTRMLAWKPSERHASLEALIQDLEALESELGNRPPPPPRPSAGRIGLALALAAALGTIAAGGLFESAELAAVGVLAAAIVSSVIGLRWLRNAAQARPERAARFRWENEPVRLGWTGAGVVAGFAVLAYTLGARAIAHEDARLMLYATAPALLTPLAIVFFARREALRRRVAASGVARPSVSRANVLRVAGMLGLVEPSRIARSLGPGPSPEVKRHARRRAFALSVGSLAATATLVGANVLAQPRDAVAFVVVGAVSWVFLALAWALGGLRPLGSPLARMFRALSFGIGLGLALVLAGALVFHLLGIGV